MEFRDFGKIILLTTLLEPAFVSFICWRSSRNLFLAHLLPLSIVSYIGGAFFLFDSKIENLGGNQPFLASLLITMMLGATAHALTFYVGFMLKTPLKTHLFRLLSRLANIGRSAPDRLSHLIVILSVVSIITQLYAYYRMGFTPLFADDPVSARFFSGKYAEPYAPFAAYLRAGFQIYVVIAPIFLISWPRSRWSKIGYLFMIIIDTGTIFLSLKRGPIASPLADIALGLFVFYRNGKYSFFGVFLYIIIYALGSLSVAILLYIIGIKSGIKIVDVVAGLPDVSDLLSFWSGFQTRNYELSWGRTVIGALIPFHNDWNPGNLTKLAVGASIEAPTGGFRLPDAIWGYVAFGYPGAVIWPAFLGALSGMQLSLLRAVTLRSDLSFFQFFIMYYAITGIFAMLASLVSISLDSVASSFFTCLVIYVTARRVQPKTG